jgi:phosphatidate cytidylyltransferase
VGILCTAVGILAAWEYVGLTRFLGETSVPAFPLLFFVPAYIFSLVFWGGRYAPVVGLVAVLLLIAMALPRSHPKSGLWASVLGVLGFLYIPWPLGLLLRIYLSGARLAPYVLIVVWAYDTGAFCAGRLLGRHRLLPEVSPSKTWEGAIGGLMVSVVVAYLLLGLSVPIDPWHAVPLGLLVGAGTQLGDLFESLLKRAAGVKDAGWLLPGHGGILDRIDGLLFALPIYWLYLRGLGLV